MEPPKTANDILIGLAKALRKEASIMTALVGVVDAMSTEKQQQRHARWLEEGRAATKELNTAAGLIEALVLGAGSKAN